MSRVWRGNLLFRVPNECVRRQIFDYMRAEYARRPHAVDTSEFVARFDAFAWDGDWRGFLTYLAEKYRDNGDTSADGADIQNSDETMGSTPDAGGGDDLLG